MFFRLRRRRRHCVHDDVCFRPRGRRRHCVHGGATASFGPTRHHHFRHWGADRPHLYQRLIGGRPRRKVAMRCGGWEAGYDIHLSLTICSQRNMRITCFAYTLQEYDCLFCKWQCCVFWRQNGCPTCWRSHSVDQSSVVTSQDSQRRDKDAAECGSDRDLEDQPTSTSRWACACAY